MTEPLPTNEAINSLRQVANAFKAARQLAEALEVVQKAETQAAALERRSVEAQREFDDIAGEIAKLKAERDKQKSALAAERKAFDDDCARKADALKAKMDQLSQRGVELDVAAAALAKRERAVADAESSVKAREAEAINAAAVADAARRDFEERTAKLKAAMG